MQVSNWHVLRNLRVTATVTKFGFIRPILSLHNVIHSTTFHFYQIFQVEYKKFL
jgi:hypothetical protein